jgi:peptidoglycan/xylan/chitin deacetylase (PgdA/CDA1 family)
MKKMAFTTLLLVIGIGVWGYYILASSNSIPRASAQIATVTPTLDTLALVKPIPPEVKEKVFSQGNDTINEIALTFDDGPDPAYTARILEILQKYQVKATFFCVGEHIQEMPELVRQELESGHALGNHTWSHHDLTKLSSQEVDTQLKKTSDALKNASGVMPVLFRPPYGAMNDRVEQQVVQSHMTPVLWSIDTEDWKLPGADAIVKSVLDNASNGSIVLMHDGGGDRSQTIAALPRIITGLQQRGFKLVTVTQLMMHAH